MIRLPGNLHGNSPRPWRKRISNQLAAFAAIMLFASTQVTPTQPQAPVAATAAAAGSEQSVALDGAMAGTESEQLAGNTDAVQLASGPNKDRRFKLSIFLLRR